MVETIRHAIENKGFLIGFFTGLLKSIQDIRMLYMESDDFTFKDVKWFIVLTDIFASTFVGYTVYSWASESVILSSWQVIGLTIFLSINAFIVVKIITDPSLVKKMIGGWLKSNNKDESSK